ncbi:MAG: hypothetical protein GX671_05905 [Clostridiales bacterium]|nr:hypothetical protein [Clostridiales bacterium]
METFSKDSNYEMAKKWMPVEKGMPDPEEDGLVLVTVSGRYQHTEFDHSIELADYFGPEDGWCISGYEAWEDPKVIAWMPVPTAYGLENEDE